MATLLREVERPAFLDAPAEEQMSLGEVALRERRRPPIQAREMERAPLPGNDRAPLSTRLRAERAGPIAGAGASARTDATRGGEATLDELLVGAWEGLSARHPVACPVCAQPMHPRTGADGGACGGCGSQLR